jgi:ankyrin repeat protein
MNALLWSSWFGHTESFCILIKAGSSSESKNKNGLSFLHCAATNGHAEVIEICNQVKKTISKK